MITDIFPEDLNNWYRFMPTETMDVSNKNDIIEHSFGGGIKKYIPRTLDFRQEILSLRWSKVPSNVTAIISRKDIIIPPENYYWTGNIIYRFLKEREDYKPFGFRLTPDDVYTYYIAKQVKYNVGAVQAIDITATFEEYKGVI